ncbi:MAG TPA: hypothetical protein VFI13_09630, partial [Gemmatimonadales bacterium]|nr:hypothetical protein [Gemmatimonadales bacterium]
ATGNLDVKDNALLVSNVTGCCGQSVWDIGGTANFAGASTRDSLTSGILYVGGDLLEGGGDPEAFAADSDFVTKFQVGGTHKVVFQDPTPAGGGGSHFGSLEFGNGAGIVLQTTTDLWAEGTLIDTAFGDPTLQGAGGTLHTLTVRDVDLQGITFDHLQLHLQKNGAPRNGVSFMDIVNFTNFLGTEDQFLVDLPGTSTQLTWSNFTFTQLAADSSDTGHYVVATDSDGGVPDVLTISLGTNQATISDLFYYLGLNGAVISPFAP